MDSIKSYALQVDVITSFDGSKYFKATTRLNDNIYTAIGVSPQDAREALVKKITADTKADSFTELPPPKPRVVDTIRETSVLVLLWLALAVLAFGLFGIVYKILEN